MNKIRLVLTDVDGTLVTREKVLTQRAVAAVRNLREAGIAFAITSGRPPRGMAMLIDPLDLRTPIAGFNGGVFVDRKLNIVEQRVLSRELVQEAVGLIRGHGLDAWIYRGNDWYVRERHGPHVDREEWTVKFAPTVVPSLKEYMDDVAKIVGVSDDLMAVAECEKIVQARFSDEVHCLKTTPARDRQPAVSAARSQPYYLDVTHPDANKGAVVEALSKMLKIAPEEIVTLGDMPNDVTMFQKSGMSIAMGQASDEVRHAATQVSTSFEEEGFANAIEQFVLAQS